MRKKYTEQRRETLLFLLYIGFHLLCCIVCVNAENNIEGNVWVSFHDDTPIYCFIYRYLISCIQMILKMMHLRIYFNMQLISQLVNYCCC